jgi:hypothetical protein
MNVLTAHQAASIDRDKKVYDMYYDLIDKGSKKTAVMDAIKARFGIYTYKTVYNIITREGKRREKL